MEKSILDIIAQTTEKTIEDVSKLYRETYSGVEPQAGAAPHSEMQGDVQSEENPADSTKSAASPFFSYGTPVTDIMRFTRDVEVFTRHIDAQARSSFKHGEQGGGAKDVKK